MNKDEIINFHFNPNDNRQPCTMQNSDLYCKLRCHEWSDGELACESDMMSIVQKSLTTGKFIWLANCMTKDKKLKAGIEGKRYDFHELQEAYRQLQESDIEATRRYFRLLLEIIHAYNDMYHRFPDVQKDIPLEDFVFFTERVLEIERIGKEYMPDSLRAELYRQIGMFDKCFEFDAMAKRDKDEQELIDEIKFRAAHHDSRPFIIEQCEYCRRGLRMTKRFSCPMRGI